MSSLRILVPCAAALLLGPAGGHAAFDPLPAGTRASTLCGAMLLSCHEPLGVAANPSIISGIPAGALELSFVPGLFGLRELRRLDLALAFPVGKGAFGSQLRSFGGALYRELSITAAFGAPLAEGCDGGLSFTFYHLSISRYGAASGWAVNAGARVRVADQALFGASIRNVNRPVLGRSGEPISMELNAFFQYDPAGWVHLLAGISKEERTRPSGGAGLEADIAGCVALRAGVNEGASEYGLGASFIFAAFELDYGMVSHVSLGLTQSVTLTIRFPSW